MFPDINDIKPIREKIGWSQLDLAKKVGVSQSAITKYEGGTQIPSYNIAKKIFQVLFDADIQLDPNIDELMTTKIISVLPITSLGKSLKLMKENSLSQIPVIKNERVLGTISETIALDLLDSFQNVNDLKDISVGEIMENPLPIVPKNSKLREVSPLLRRFGAVLICQRKEIIGIVSKADLLDY